MSGFDWTRFVQSHGIDHALTGKNVRRGWVNVQCPWCGSADPGKHLGLNPETGGYACWRDPSHRGRNVPRLIEALLGCGYARARELAGDWQEPGPATHSDFRSQMEALDTEQADTRPKPVHYPARGFYEIGETGSTANYFDYLLKRGFKARDAQAVADQYHLRAALDGRYGGRLILPFLGRKDRVYGWQGRAISKSAELRYLSYPDSERAKHLLFNYGPAWSAPVRKALVIVEGPIGSLKVDFYGQRQGIRSVALTGTGFMPRQVSLLYALAPRYAQVLVLLDPGAEAVAWDLTGRLSSLRPQLGNLPDGLDGPDDLEPRDVVPVVRDQLSTDL